MITKEQALTANYFQEVTAVSINPPLNTHTKQRQWRRNGKTKVWKSADRSEHFRVPVKHGLYSYGYIEYTFDEDNRALFEVVS